MFIPNGAVGAMIGTKGTHIRNIIQLSGASMKIAQEPEDVSRGTFCCRSFFLFAVPPPKLCNS